MIPACFDLDFTFLNLLSENASGSTAINIKGCFRIIMDDETIASLPSESRTLRIENIFLPSGTFEADALLCNSLRSGA